MSAADHLANLTLSNGWTVTRLLGRNPSSTGGHFSQSYEVEKTDTDASGKPTVRKGFLKAFDFQKAFEPGVDTVKVLQYLTTAYEHERDILEHCKHRGLSNVVVAHDHGDVQVPNMSSMEGRVFYLIFEMATGDVRVQMSSATARDNLWSMKALRSVSLGLWQVHKELVAHQDAKPSNVLVYANNEFKIADFGRSAKRDRSGPHDQLIVAGDRTYSPPELLYGHTHADFVPRRIGCDLYMLGNLASFLFTGVNVTSQLFLHLDPQHHHRVWGGTYEQVLPYLMSSFSRVLDDLEKQLAGTGSEEIVRIVAELCTPDLDKRGHPRGIGKPGQYSLERYVSMLDRSVQLCAIRTRIHKRAI